PTPCGTPIIGRVASVTHDPAEPAPAAPAAADAWYAREQAGVVAALETDAERGLSAATAAQRLAEHGPNQIRGEEQPSIWQVDVEAGDILPADGRLMRSATLETQEAALTGESAPVAKDPAVVAGDAALGDRTDMLFQNTSVTRGTGAMVVTATGMDTEMGRIA